MNLSFVREWSQLLKKPSVRHPLNLWTKYLKNKLPFQRNHRNNLLLLNLNNSYSRDLLISANLEESTCLRKNSTKPSLRWKKMHPLNVEEKSQSTVFEEHTHIYIQFLEFFNDIWRFSYQPSIREPISLRWLPPWYIKSLLFPKLLLTVCFIFPC